MMVKYISVKSFVDNSSSSSVSNDEEHAASRPIQPAIAPKPVPVIKTSAVMPAVGFFTSAAGSSDGSDNDGEDDQGGSSDSSCRALPLLPKRRQL